MSSARPGVGTSTRSLAVGLTFLALAALSLLVPFVPAVARVLLTFVNIAIVVLYLMLRRPQEPRDYLEVVIPYSILHIFSFGLGAVYLSYYPKTLLIRSLVPYITPAVALGLFGYCAFLAGYSLLATRTPPSRSAGLAPRGAFACLLPAALGVAGYLAGSEPVTRILTDLGMTGAASLVAHLAPLFLFSWFLSWVVFWRSPKRLRNQLVVLSVVPAAVLVVYLTLGSKELGITVLAFPVLAFGYARRKFPVKSVLALVLVLVFVIFPLYNTFRLQTRNLGTVERLGRSVSQATRWDTQDYTERSVGAFFSRMAVVTSVAAILRDTGRWVEFARGRTLILMPIGLFIPRFVWPEKPVLNVGREFGETFQLIGSSDEETNVAPTMIGELYWNFHIPGVLIGMLLLGAASRWYYERFGRGGGYDPIRRSMYIALLPAALHSEGSIAITVGGIIKTIVLFSVLAFLLRRSGALVPVPSEDHAA